MHNFLSGLVTAGFLIAALYFFRFWKTTRDRFFAVLGVAFLLFAANQLGVVALQTPREEQSWIYLFRLFGFALLIVAIVLKNLPKARE